MWMEANEAVSDCPYIALYSVLAITCDSRSYSDSAHLSHPSCVGAGRKVVAERWTDPLQSFRLSFQNLGESIFPMTVPNSEHLRGIAIVR